MQFFIFYGCNYKQDIFYYRKYIGQNFEKLLYKSLFQHIHGENMRFVIQRVKEAHLNVYGKVHCSIGAGFVILVGYGANEMLPENRIQAEQSWSLLLNRVLGLRVFPDLNGKMNIDLDEFGGELLLVSQFTLYADCRKGKRPSFHLSAPAEIARVAYNALIEKLKERLGERLKTGIFGADMDIQLVNWGPVTFVLDSVDF